jgi:hypothetical protein
MLRKVFGLTLEFMYGPVAKTNLFGTSGKHTQGKITMDEGTLASITAIQGWQICAID